jgi:hypothetical protein
VVLEVEPVVARMESLLMNVFSSSMKCHTVSWLGYWAFKFSNSLTMTLATELASFLWVETVVGGGGKAGLVCLKGFHHHHQDFTSVAGAWWGLFEPPRQSSLHRLAQRMCILGLLTSLVRPKFHTPYSDLESRSRCQSRGRGGTGRPLREAPDE